MEGSAYTVSEVLPPSGHPRVYITEDKISAICENVQKDGIRPVYEKYKSYAEKSINCKLDKSKEHNYDENLLLYIKAKAFMYVTGLDTSRGSEAVVAMCNFLDTVKINDANVTYTRRDKGETIYTTALVYDWCYDLLDTDTKKFFADKAIEMASSSTQATTYPDLLDTESAVGGQTGESCIFRDLLSLGIAIYDENPEVYEKTADAILNKMAPSRKLFSDTGMHPEGNSYGMTRYGYEADAVLMFTAMGYGDIFGENFYKVPYKWIYDRRPDGIFMKDADDFISNTYLFLSYPRNDTKGLIAAAYLGGDAALKRQLLNNLSLSKYSGNLYILLYAPDFSGMKLSGEEMLPLSYKTGSPLPSVTARTSWQSGLSADTAIVRMNMYERNIASHMHQDSGSFEIYYKGPLAVDGGIYQGVNGEWGGRYYMNYASRTVAHNLITVLDKNEKYIYNNNEYANDGGQRRVTESSTVKTYGELMSDATLVSEEKASFIGPQQKTPAFSYIKGDLTKAYSDKISEYTRSMVFCDLFSEEFPAAFIVYDRVTSSDASFEKNWLLHSVEKPKVYGNKTIIERTQQGYGGRLVNSCLLPKEIETEKISGDTVNGVKYENSVSNGVYDEGGNWRIEISPAVNQNEDKFLNVMYVTDAGNTNEMKSAYIESDYHAGAAIGDRAVLFSKNGKNIDESFNISLPEGSNEYLCMICDVAEGAWNISGEGVNISVESSEGENCIVFSCHEGEYTVSKSGGGEIQTFSNMPKKNFGDFRVLYENEFVFLENSTKIVDSEPYVCVTTLKEMGAEVTLSDVGCTIKKNGRVLEVSSGGSIAYLNGTRFSLDGKVQSFNDEIYIKAKDLCTILSASYEYDALAEIVKFTPISEQNVSGMLDVSEAFCSDEAEDYPLCAIFDKNLSTHYRGAGKGSHVTYDFGRYVNTESVSVKFHSGMDRDYLFEIQVSADGASYTSAGTFAAEKSNEIQNFVIKSEKIRYIRLVCNGDYFSVCEFSVFGAECLEACIVLLNSSAGSESITAILPDGFEKAVISVGNREIYKTESYCGKNYVKVDLSEFEFSGSTEFTFSAEYGDKTFTDTAEAVFGLYTKTEIFGEDFEGIVSVPEKPDENVSVGNVKIFANETSSFYAENGALKIKPLSVHKWGGATISCNLSPYFGGSIFESTFDVAMHGAIGIIRFELKNYDGSETEPTISVLLDSDKLIRKDQKYSIKLLLDSENGKYKVFANGDMISSGDILFSGAQWLRISFAAPESSDMYYLVDNIRINSYTPREPDFENELIESDGESITYSADYIGNIDFFAAVYKDGMLYDVSRGLCDGTKISATMQVPSNGKIYVKVFFWEDYLRVLNPVKKVRVFEY